MATPEAAQVSTAFSAASASSLALWVTRETKIFCPSTNLLGPGKRHSRTRPEAGAGAAIGIGSEGDAMSHGKPPGDEDLERTKALEDALSEYPAQRWPLWRQALVYPCFAVLVLRQWLELRWAEFMQGVKR